MDLQINVLDVYDFTELKNQMSRGANETLEEIENKGLEDEFLTAINDLLRVDADSGKPMTKEELDDLLDYEPDYIGKLMNVKLF